MQVLKRFTIAILWAGVFGLAAAAVGRPSSAADGPLSIPAVHSVLHLTNRDYLDGRLVASDGAEQLAWQSPAFRTPLVFRLDAVHKVQFPTSGNPPEPPGDFCFELAAGDVLTGSLLALRDNVAEIEVVGLGRLHVDLSVMRRIYRINKQDLVYSGPGGLESWQTLGNASAWHDDGGQFTADQPGAILRRDCQAPARARFEVDLSWNKKADFELAFGVGDDPKSIQRAFRFEVWDSKLVVWRETEREADVVALTQIEPGAGHISLQALLDQDAGRMLVLSSSGQQLADLSVATTKPQPRGGVQLTNRGGDIRLERLRVGRWNGEVPQAVDSDKARIHGVDGTITYGSIKSYDAASKRFLVDVGGAERSLDESQVQDVFLAQTHEAKGKSLATFLGERAKSLSRSLRVVHRAGHRLSGELLKVADDQVWLRSPGIAEPIPSPIAALHALLVLEHQGQSTNLPAREGRLEIDGLLLHGCLRDGREADGGCLVFQPRHALDAAALQHGLSGRVIYREPPPPPKPKQQAARAPGLVRVQVGQVKAANAEKPEPATKQPRPTPTASVLHLRTGDTITCRVTAIDERGVTFETTQTDATFVSHDKIQALELMPEAKPTTIAKPKKERLLTVPRMQRDNPPTHLIRGIDGDYLRGRLVAMDLTNMAIELRLETKKLPRDGVARIIWLHPDEAAADPAAREKPPADPGLLIVQALQGDGKRLTFTPAEVAGTVLSGQSELLGNCRVDLQQVDQLLFGTAIEKAAAALAFHQWKLTAAADPLAAPDGEGEGGSEGLESALVGKAAPDFDLELIGGKKFRLSAQKEKVIVLDFWASWCGPCLQAMPQVDRVAREFADRGVELVAVNLQETPEQVQTALERLKLETTVALDRDGRVAERYGATAIPQTVIVDRDGKVARLFVGGGARFDEQLRSALDSVLSGGAPEKSAAEKTAPQTTAAEKNAGESGGAEKN